MDTFHGASIKSLEHLRDLALSGNPIEKLIEFNSKLEYLVLYKTKIKDLQPLADQHKLEKIHVDGEEVEDFSPLYDLKNLESVIIGYRPSNVSDKKLEEWRKMEEKFQSEKFLGVNFRKFDEK